MKKNLWKNEHFKSAVIAIVFVAVLVMIAFFLDWLNIKDPMFWRLIFIFVLVALGVPAWLDKHYTKIRDEEAKINKDIERIKKS